jgi:hypothetical protein
MDAVQFVVAVAELDGTLLSRQPEVLTTFLRASGFNGYANGSTESARSDRLAGRAASGTNFRRLNERLCRPVTVGLIRSPGWTTVNCYSMSGKRNDAL